MTDIREAYELRLDYEAFEDGYAEDMEAEQGLKYAQMVAENPDLAVLTEVYRRKVAYESALTYNVSTEVGDMMDEYFPVSRIDVYMEERELEARVRRQEFAEKQRPHEMALRELADARRQHIARKIGELGFMHQVLPEEERAEIIRFYAKDWHFRLQQAQAGICLYEEYQLQDPYRSQGAI